MMKFQNRFFSYLTASLCAVGLAACGGGDGDGGKKGTKNGGDGPKRYDVKDSSVFPITAGKYTILGIKTDQGSLDRAQQQAEDTITNHPDIACMVGLWAYNAPRILNAVDQAGEVGKIKIVSFDEDAATLEGIAAESIHGTIAQQPYLFGYRSAELLAAIVRGQEVNKEGSDIIVPVIVVKKDDVANFKATVESILAGNGSHPEPLYEGYPATDEKVSAAFVTNSVNPFWDFSKHGFKLACEKYNIDGKFIEPADATVEQQNRMIEEQISVGVQAFAVSPIDAVGQSGFLKQVSDKAPLICQDSDSPESGRKFYLGTSNYLAGREAGKLIKEVIPDGGKVMLFVGKMEVLNAQERSQGVVDELLGLPIPE